MTDEEWVRCKGREFNPDRDSAGLSCSKGDSQLEVGVGGVLPGDRAQIGWWKGGEMDSSPACGRTFQVPGLPPTQCGDCRSDPPITGVMQDNDDLAEGFRWVLSIEEQICLDYIFKLCFGKEPFLSR